MKKTIFSLLIAIPIFFSCSDDNDTQKPTIEILSPENETVFNPGETISLSVIFADNEELASYKIEIHINTDGHNHKSSTLVEAPFEFNQEANFEKGLNRFDLNLDIPIPTTIEGVSIKEGEYHLGIHCIDKAGNEREAFIVVDIEDVRL
jgi:hypothetical protein